MPLSVLRIACTFALVASLFAVGPENRASPDNLGSAEILERAEKWYARTAAYRDEGEIVRTVLGPRKDLGRREYREAFRQQFSRPHEYEFILERAPGESRSRSTVLFTMNSQGVFYELRFEDEEIVHTLEYDKLGDASGNFRAQPFHMTHADLIGVLLPDEATHQAKVHNPLSLIRERNHGAASGEPREISRLDDEQVDGVPCFVLRAEDVRRTDHGRITERITLWIQHDPPLVRQLEQKTVRDVGMEMPMTDTRVTRWRPETPG